MSSLRADDGVGVGVPSSRDEFEFVTLDECCDENSTAGSSIDERWSLLDDDDDVMKDVCFIANEEIISNINFTIGNDVQKYSIESDPRCTLLVGDVNNNSIGFEERSALERLHATGGGKSKLTDEPLSVEFGDSYESRNQRKEPIWFEKPEFGEDFEEIEDKNISECDFYDLSADRVQSQVHADKISGISDSSEIVAEDLSRKLPEDNSGTCLKNHLCSCHSCFVMESYEDFWDVNEDHWDNVEDYCNDPKTFLRNDEIYDHYPGSRLHARKVDRYGAVRLRERQRMFVWYSTRNIKLFHRKPTFAHY